MTVKHARKAGGRWRLAASKLTARGTMFPGGMYGDTIKVEAADYGPNEFDELVVGHWFHMEQMDTGSWWMRVGGQGGLVVWVDADRDGHATRVSIPDPPMGEDGCVYRFPEDHR